MIQAGGGLDEYVVEAGQLNQVFIGMEFAFNKPSSTVYGRLAGVRVYPGKVTIWLDGVPGEAGILDLAPSDRLYFSHYTNQAQVQVLLERLVAIAEGRK